MNWKWLTLLFVVPCVAGCQPVEPSAEAIVFPIGGYSGNPERDKGAGFTVAGPIYGEGRKESFLKECERVGLPFFYPVGVKIDFHGRRGSPVKTLDWEAIAAEVEEQVRAVAHHPQVYAWYLTPEELRHWRNLELKYLQVASEAIRNADPKQRPIWMYEPGHRTQAALEKTIPHMGIGGKGLYVNYAGRKNERTWVGWTLEEQNRAIAAANPAAIPIAVPEMFQEPPAGEEHLIPAWVRHDCYVSLLKGTKGIVIFSLAKRRGFPSHAVYYNAYAEVARELNGPLKLGAVFLKGEPQPLPRFRVVEGRENVELTAGSSGPKEAVNVPTLRHGSYRWEGRDYFFLVNSSSEPVTIELEGRRSWEPLFDEQPRFEPDGETLRLPPLAVAAFIHPES